MTGEPCIDRMQALASIRVVLGVSCWEEASADNEGVECRSDSQVGCNDANV